MKDKINSSHQHTQMGFKHCKSTLLHSRANAECESFMRTLGKVIKLLLLINNR